MASRSSLINVHGWFSSFISFPVSNLRGHIWMAKFAPRSWRRWSLWKFKQKRNTFVWLISREKWRTCIIWSLCFSFSLSHLFICFYYYSCVNFFHAKSGLDSLHWISLIKVTKIRISFYYILFDGLFWDLKCKAFEGPVWINKTKHT